jgi:hypothetical protein
MATVINIWPKGVGYDTQSGYHVERYNSNEDQIQRAQQLVEAWKATASTHGFRSENVQKLSCLSSDGSHRLSFLSNTGELVILESEVRAVEADADIDEDPADTCIGIKISGKNLASGRDFTFNLSVYRFPTVRISTSYSDTV